MRKAASRTRVTVYRLTGLEPLDTLIRDKYLDRPEFVAERVNVAGTTGLLVHGQIRAESVRWAGDLAGYTGLDIEAHNDTAAAVLLLKVERYVYALCYGWAITCSTTASWNPASGCSTWHAWPTWTICGRSPGTLSTAGP
jgi:Family of unknown function (DUF6119)